MSEALAVQSDADLFNDPDFARAIQQRTKQRAQAAFHGPLFNRLLEIAAGDDVKAAMSAITLVGKLAGEFKAPRPVVLSFDELQKRAATVEAGPLSELTQIREAEIIDVDDEGDATTE